MPKLNFGNVEAAVVNEDIKEKLKKDILRTGFPFEMEVSKILERNNWSVKNSSYYIDKDENKGREIDIISTIHQNKYIQRDLYLEVCFSLVVEIKKTEEKPWVFFTSEVNRVEENLPLDYTYSNFSSKGYTLNRILRENIRKANARLGRNFYEGFTKNGGRDDIYKALSGTSKATYHALENCLANNDKAGDRLFHFFESVVVIKGKLFEAFLNDKGEINLEETKYIQCQFNYMSPNYISNRHKVVHVITSDYLEKFIRERKESLNGFFCDLVNEELVNNDVI